MKYPNSGQFKKELDNGRIDRVYLFLGEEEGEKDKFITRILDLVFSDPVARAQSTGRFHIENDEFMEAAEFALSSSMFYSKKVCIMRNIDKLKAGKSAGTVIQDVAENLPDSTILIMTSIEKKPPAAIASAFKQQIKIIQFWKYFDQDIYNYVHLNLKKMNLEIEDKAATFLIERTGKDIKKIDDALDMIRFSGVSGIVTHDMIKNYISFTREVSIFEFVDFLFKKERYALKMLKKLLEDGTPELTLLYMIVRQAEMIEKYYSMIDDGATPDDAMNKSGVYSRNKNNFLQYIQKFPPVKLKQIFPIIGKTDYMIKSKSLSKTLTANPIFTLVDDIFFSI